MITKSLWSSEISHALVVDCSDPRLPQARAEMLAKMFGISHPDPIIVPGGPALFVPSASFYFIQHEWVELLDGTHKFEKIIGLAHLDCLYYKKKYPADNQAEIYNRQINDLRNFRIRILEIIPGGQVELLYASPNQDGFIAYTNII